MSAAQEAPAHDRREALRHAIDHAGHYLPSQGPIGVFVHHNTLHAFEHLPFHDAVGRASELFDAQPYLSESVYRAHLARGRITTRDIDAALRPRREARRAIPAASVGPFDLDALDEILLRYAVASDEPVGIRWQLAEHAASRKLRWDVPTLARNRFLERSHTWLDALIKDYERGALTADAFEQRLGAGRVREEFEGPWDASTFRHTFTRAPERLAVGALWCHCRATPLRDVRVCVLDVGLMQAGASMKGEFEQRLRQVIDEVQASPKPIILFIDEAHTLIGAGGAAGQNDAANLLKPALARGELRTIAATTFAEYKKYFEGDAALKRRFQQVKVDEPDERRATRMLRGLVAMLEKHHKVRILDEAVVDAVRLSTRYMPDRQLPDKAVSLLDTVCARVALSQSATPPALEDTQREITHLSNEIEFLEREGRVSAGNPERVADLRSQLTLAEQRRGTLTEQLTKEKELVGKIQAKRGEIEQAAGAATDAAKAELAAQTDELAALQGENPLVYPVVSGGAVATVVSGLTGIPLGKMVRNEIATVLKLADRLAERVVGQNHALDAIAQRIRTARADLADPRRPQGVFLLVGPSGVGKTETAMALADLLYGGDRNMVIVNMSEYKESHKVSRLVGTSKGYVGYGEGGVLTNAVKNRPYSVVLLDEVEKAHESVQEIFYQVFDKGVLQNDDGEDVNFKNTIILLTANVGTDIVMKACADPDTAPSAAGLDELLRPELQKAFKPALLGRMTVVPYFPLGDEVLKSIIGLKLKQIGDRLRTNYKATFTVSPAVIDAVAARCKDVDSGARNADHIITGTVLPRISEEVLVRLAEGRPVKAVTVGVAPDGELTFTVE